MPNIVWKQLFCEWLFKFSDIYDVKVIRAYKLENILFLYERKNNYIVCIWLHMKCSICSLLFHDGRHTWLTYFSRKVGGTLDCGYRKTCPRIIEYLTWIGCTISGDPIASSKMRRRLPSTRCQYQTIISGCIMIKRCFTCPSKSVHFSYYVII